MNSLAVSMQIQGNLREAESLQQLGLERQNSVLGDIDTLGSQHGKPDCDFEKTSARKRGGRSLSDFLGPTKGRAWRRSSVDSTNHEQSGENIGRSKQQGKDDEEMKTGLPLA
jgi:hypothetical protein